MSTATRRSALLRWSGLGAIVYVILFVVASTLAFRGPLGDDTPAEVRSYFSDGGHRDRVHFAYLLILIGIVFLLWFVAGLREVVRGLAGDGLLASATAIGGAVYAALTLVAFSVFEGIFTMSDDTYRHTVYPGLIHAASDTGYAIHSAGGAGMAVMIFAVSFALLGSRAVPAWLGWLSILAGVVAIFSIFFFPWFVIALWLVVAGILVTRALGRPATA